MGVARVINRVNPGQPSLVNLQERQVVLLRVMLPAGTCVKLQRVLLQVLVHQNPVKYGIINQVSVTRASVERVVILKSRMRVLPFLMMKTQQRQQVAAAAAAAAAAVVMGIYVASLVKSHNLLSVSLALGSHAMIAIH